MPKTSLETPPSLQFTNKIYLNFKGSFLNKINRQCSICSLNYLS